MLPSVPSSLSLVVALLASACTTSGPVTPRGSAPDRVLTARSTPASPTPAAVVASSAPPSESPDASDAPATPQRVHVFSLPRQVYDEDTGYVPARSMAPGELPSAAHPAGTVFLALASIGTSHLVVSEWDLASGEELRQAPIPVPPEDSSVWMVRAGDRLHLVAWQYNDDIQYACMATRDLSPVHSERLGHISTFGPAALASDGTVTIFVAPITLRSDEKWWLGRDGYYGVTFDQNGLRIAARPLEKPHKGADGYDHEYSFGLGHNAVVVDGRPYVLVATPDEHRFRLQRLRPDLTVEHETALRIPGEFVEKEQLSLSAGQDHLAVNSYGDPPLRILSSLAPKELSRGAPCPRDPGPQGDAYVQHVWLGHVLAALYQGDNGKFRIAWTESTTGPSAPALCGAAP